MMGRVSLVAHRGQPLTFPENSLPGFVHALEAGARYVETDIQISADGIPLLSHDANLLKLSGKQIIIADHDLALIKEIPVGYAERFGDHYADYRIATLAQLVELMQSWPDARCFVELKAASLQNFGMKAVDLVLEKIAPIHSQIILISYEYDALSYAKAQDRNLQIGWVLPAWSDDNLQLAGELAPQYLFVDDEFCPQDQADIWPGDWQWAVYTVNDSERVAYYAGLGIEIIETDRYSELVDESDIIEVSTDF